jgi:hypothetical protein
MSNKSYYLFGELSSEYYHLCYGSDISNEEMAFHINENFDYEIFMYDSEYNHPEDLLFEYDGWNGYATINESLYNELLKFKNL